MVDGHGFTDEVRVEKEQVKDGLNRARSKAEFVRRVGSSHADSLIHCVAFPEEGIHC